MCGCGCYVTTIKTRMDGWSVCVRRDQSRFPKVLPTVPAVLHFSKSSDFFKHAHPNTLNQNLFKGSGWKIVLFLGRWEQWVFVSPQGPQQLVSPGRPVLPQESSGPPHQFLLDDRPPPHPNNYLSISALDPWTGVAIAGLNPINLGFILLINVVVGNWLSAFYQIGVGDSTHLLRFLY